jgi:hypothetical protein
MTSMAAAPEPNRSLDHDSEVLADYLGSLPRRAVVPWASDHVRARTPWASRWVDVRLLDPGAPPMGWAWTIVGHDDPDGTDPQNSWCFQWPYDLDIYEVWESQAPPRIMPKLILEIPARHHRPLPPGVERALAMSAARADRSIVDVGGWSVATITAGLTLWTALIAGRGDLQLRWDADAGPSPRLQTIAERAASSGPFWDLGDGLVAHDEAMDELMRDPASAAEVEKHVRDVLSEMRRIGGSR